MSTEVKVVIIVVVLIAVIGVAAAASFFIYFPYTAVTRVSNPGPVTITGIYLAIFYNSSSASYFGSSYRILNPGPVYLQHLESYKVSFTLYLGPAETTHYIDRIGLVCCFTPQSTSPNPPFQVSPGTSTTITIAMWAPPTDYNGPVTINLFTH